MSYEPSAMHGVANIIKYSREFVGDRPALVAWYSMNGQDCRFVLDLNSRDAQDIIAGRITHLHFMIGVPAEVKVDCVCVGNPDAVFGHIIGRQVKTL